jgi:anoctamin-10
MWLCFVVTVKVQQYFGEKLALYFAFLGLYTLALIPPALIGVIYYVTSWNSVYREAIFAVFNVIWATIFLEFWKRHCSVLSYQFGTMDLVPSDFEEPRANYHGSDGKNPVTGKREPYYPKMKKLLRFYGCTVPVVTLFLAVAFYIMLAYFWLQVTKS